MMHPWVVESTYPGLPDIASHVWNMQKSLISIGMILIMLEAQVSSNEWLALHDELTGLPNRRLFAARLTSAIEYADRKNTGLALVVLDVNDFKKINDTLGHVAGDQVLREVSVDAAQRVFARPTRWPGAGWRRVHHCWLRTCRARVPWNALRTRCGPRLNGRSSSTISR